MINTIPDGSRLRKAAIAAMLLLGLAIFSTRILAPPLTPHGVAGYIFESDGATQVQLGTSYSINETASGDFLRTKTSIPVPGLTGRYFEAVSGSDGDTVVVMAWNLTHYGRTLAALSGDMDNVNVTVNTTRPSEANVTVLWPPNNMAINITNQTNVTINVSIIGSNGTGCNATISFSHPSVLNISSGETATHAIGNISVGGYNTTAWNITATGVINTTINLQAACENQQVNLEGTHIANVSNATVIDLVSPILNLSYPANNSLVQLNNITFLYNVTEPSGLANCSLVINDIINTTNTTAVNKGGASNITQYLPNGAYNWTVRCQDISGNIGNGTNYNFTVNLTAPSLTNVLLTNPVNLLAGASSTVWCNSTVTIPPGAINISNVNATLFDGAASAYNSVDDNNNHYTNTSCANLTLPGESADYGCAFPVLYYANNATWTCRITATDNRSLSGFSTQTALINELVAMSAGSTLDFGSVAPDNTSNDTSLALENLGNRNINISARGYGILPAGDNLSMTCGADGNISITNERYSAANNTDYDGMANLTNQSTMVTNFTVFQKTNDAQAGNELNSTFWKLKIPEGIGGNCNGTIVLAASLA